jgi:lysophospholipase L1-like esterase
MGHGRFPLKAALRSFSDKNGGVRTITHQLGSVACDPGPLMRSRKRPERRISINAVVLAAALLVAGCGSSTGPGQTGAGGVGGAAGAGGSPGTGGSSLADAGRGGDGGTAGPGDAGAGGPTDAASSDGPRTDAGGDTSTRADGGAPLDAGGDAGPRTDAGGDGVVAYAPCPTNGAPCIVMPLGDSITDGFPFENGGYRVELFHQAVQASTPITFVGRNANGPATVDGMPFPRNHEGYSGFTIDTDATHNGISPLVDAAITMFRPHVILLHIGTNDVNGNVDLANAPTRLAALLDRLTSDAPAALLVVAQIIPTTNDGTNTRVRNYNAAIPALVQQRAAAGKHVLLLDMYTVFSSRTDYKTALMNDTLHPNVAGYAAMGDAWYGSIRAALPAR